MSQIKTSAKLSKDQRSFINNFKATLTVASPGRINLIGGHTDYNDGFVLPTAIDKKINFYLRKNKSTTICSIFSSNYETFLEVNLKSVKISANEWENYVLGVINELQKRTDKILGFDCIIDSKLPIGAGISSSAALECGLAFGLNELFDLQLSKEILIELSRDAEHSFVGTKCGIMDQFAVMMSKKDHFLLLDCKYLSYDLIPVDIEPYKILLLNTNVSHNLATSEYNTRREECEAGVKLIQKKYTNITSLRSVTETVLNEFKTEMSATIYKRCLYIIRENERVINATKALKSKDLNTFGKLIYATHQGLQHEYEVSCDELDYLIDFSKNNEHILGARMMGGGFGGCTINLIHQDAIDPYIEEVSVAYKKKFGIDLSPIIVTPSEGTSILKSE